MIRYRPAGLLDIVELYTGGRPARRLDLQCAIVQAVRAPAMGFYADAGAGERLEAVLMFYPLAPERPGEELAELVFHCRPELGAGGALAVVRFARLMAAALPQDGSVRVRAIIRSPAGARLAELAGFAPSHREAGGLAVWEWSGRREQFRPKPVQRSRHLARGGGAPPEP